MITVRAGGLVSLRIRPRSAGVTAALTVGALGLGVIALGLGDVKISAVDVVRTLVGHTSPVLETVVVDWRLPRVVLALMFGAALGLGGAIFQSLTRNPLGSPDVIGFDTGAYTGAVITIIAVGTTALVIPGALIGGMVTAVVVYVFAYRHGVHGFRFIVVGIAVTSLLGSLNTYLILRADLWTAQMAAIWGAGSLNGLDWADVRRGAVAISIATLVVICFARRLEALDLGDDAAAALGVRLEPVRLGLMVGGIALTATVTALAGPIFFVSLAAPQLARRLTRSPGVTLVPSAAMGAFLLVSCDLVALYAFPAVLPVGLITVVLGGAYLVWLLLLQARKEIR